MLQLLHLNVLKVDRMLHVGCTWEAANGADDGWGNVGDVWSGADDVQDSVSSLLVRSLASPTCQTLACSVCGAAGTVQTLAPGSDIRALASPKKKVDTYVTAWDGLGLLRLYSWDCSHPSSPGPAFPHWYENKTAQYV
jgi:hypothetical protein